MKNNEDETEHWYCIELVHLSSGWLKISSILPKNEFFISPSSEEILILRTP